MASPAHYAADPLAPAIALSARRRSTTQSLSGARHAARDALRSTSFPSVKPRSSLRDQIGISHTGPLKQALRLLLPDRSPGRTLALAACDPGHRGRDALHGFAAARQTSSAAHPPTCVRARTCAGAF